MNKQIIWCAIALLAISNTIFGQSGSGEGGNNKIVNARKAILTAVPFLTVGPDARAAGLGDAGVALDPDANATYWNAAKLPFIEGKPMGFAFSYTPWLRNIINDMNIVYLTGYYQITKEQAVSFNLKYFDMGDIDFTNELGDPNGSGFPREFAFGVNYSRKLTDKSGLGVGLKYISSNLLNGYSAGGGIGSSVAFDLSYFYKTQFYMGTRSYRANIGANISDIGSKMSYVQSPAEDQEQFLPANFRLGTALTAELDPYNTLTFALDFNKLLVPSPVAGDSIGGQKSYLGGVFGSFADADGGFSEEMQEITVSMGLEYWYNRIFAVRAGYFYEDPEKGGRNYYSMGFGLKYQQMGFDFAYWISPEKNSPLSESLRFTLTFDLEADPIKQQSVQDN